MLESFKFPLKTNWFLGPRKDTWCDFHQAFRHGIERCITLSYQLEDLVKEFLLTEYLEVDQKGLHMEAASSDQRHEAPVLGEMNTIAGGFFGGRSSASKSKRYARFVMALDTKELGNPTNLSFCFTKINLEDMFPYEDDPMVISVATIGRKVHKVLIDQGSSAHVMFWGTSVYLQISLDQLTPYDGCLVSLGDQVEVHEYGELRTTFFR